MSVRGISYSPRAFPDRVSYPRNRARGGLIRGTARTIRARPCRPGTFPIATTAATRHLTRHSRSRNLHARFALTLPRATRLKPHSIAFPFILTFTPGDAAASPDVSLNRMMCSLSLVTRGSLSARRAWRLRLRLWREKCRVAAVVAIWTVPGLHGRARVVRAVPRTRPPRARLREVRPGPETHAVD